LLRRPAQACWHARYLVLLFAVDATRRSRAR
jgi:hypothetical protein